MKSVLSLDGILPDRDLPYVITASTDEYIRIWNTELSEKQIPKTAKSNAAMAFLATEAFANSKRPPDLVRDIEGHSHEVSKLAIWRRKRESGAETAMNGGGDQIYLVSSSMDCTIRKWPLLGILGMKALHQSSVQKTMSNDSNEAPATPVMTAEEEAELAELMDED